MTRSASFGPVFVNATFPSLRTVYSTYIELLVIIKHEKKRKKHTNGPKQHVWGHLGPFSLSPSSLLLPAAIPKPFRALKALIIPKTIVSNNKTRI